jgi:hypothetical protein
MSSSLPRIKTLNELSKNGPANAPPILKFRKLTLDAGENGE